MHRLTNDVSEITGACVYALNDCMRFCIDPTCTDQAGSNAFVTFQVTALAQATGLQFTIANTVFETDNALDSNTDTKVNLATGTALEKANRIKAMIESNSDLSSLVTVTVTDVAPNANVSVTFIDRYNIAPFVHNFSLLTSPYTVLFQGAGTDQIIKDCCTVGWSVWQVASNGTKTKVSQDYVSNFARQANNLPITNCIEINSVIRPLMGTTFPMSPGTWASITTESNTYKRFVFKYRRITCPDGCGKVLEEEFESPIIRVLNSYLNQDDIERLCPYNDVAVALNRPVRPFLTERPFFHACPNMPDWLYLLQTELTAGQNYWAVFETAAYGSNTWTAWGAPISIPGVTGGAVTRIPVGLKNLHSSLPALPSGAARYRISIMDSTQTLVHSRETFVINSGSCPCTSDQNVTFYFLNKFGTVDQITFCEPTEVAIEGEQNYECQTAPCISQVQESYTGIESAFINGVSQRMTSGQYRVVSSDFYRMFKVTARDMPAGEDVEKFIQSFLTSPLKYALFSSGTITTFRQVYVALETAVVRRAGGSTELSISFFYTKKDERHI